MDDSFYPATSPPCCSAPLPRHVRTLPDVDEVVSLNVYQCSRCGLHWVDAGNGYYRGWEAIAPDELTTILHTGNTNWVKLWADNRGLIP